MTNRFDLYQAASQYFPHSHFNDFDFSPFEQGCFDKIVYRVSKERPIVHHIINEAFHYLKPNGQLILCGHNQEGIKTHIQNASKRFAAQANVTLHKQFRLATFSKGETQGKRLDDKNYGSFRTVTDKNGQAFYTKPGIFGWNKIDVGSEFLAFHLAELLDRNNLREGSLLDLGCGYGYLSVMANRLGHFTITATDNNAAAIAACQKNFHANEISGSVSADDSGRSIKTRFDGIVCNPPFHTGFDTSDQLTNKFLQQTHHLLKKQSKAFFVCNQFIPIEKKAAPLFSQIETTHSNKRFKLVTLLR